MQPLIDISPDDTYPEGGHAIVVVRDVTALPERVRFSIRALPDDPDNPAPDTAWSLDEQAPLAADLTPDGLVLKIGPDVVDAPQLQPGTPVAFAVPAANVSAEISWPDLPVTIPDSLPVPVMDPSELRVHKIENKRLEAEAAARAEADKAMVDAIAASLASDPTLEEDVADQAPSPVINLADLSAALRPAATGARPRRTETAPREPSNFNLATAPAAPVLNLAVDAPHGTAQPDHPTAAGEPSPRMPPPSASRAIVPIARVADAPHDNVVRRDWLSIVLSVIAVPAILFALWPMLSGTAARQPSAPAGLNKVASSDWVARVFAVGDVSPAGTSAADLSANDALQRAEAAIFDKAGKSSIAERRYWLRKSISLMLAKPDTSWAMTQLGTLHTAGAVPRRQAEYGSAKTLWEIASASGDTVATCFLAHLYELGLGVDVSPEKARQWHTRASERGGCNVQHERPTTALTN
ncbi:MAG: hypothetical protein ACR2PI_17390 [Hyphomicrobiaceae bacterium]